MIYRGQQPKTPPSWRDLGCVVLIVLGLSALIEVAKYFSNSGGGR